MSDKIKFFNSSQIDKILDTIDNIKHKVIVLLMLDAGLRVSETISLKYKDFDFKKEVIKVRSLKKRKGQNSQYRTIPISKRLYQALAEYLGKMSNVESEDYLFPSPVKHLKGNHISRHSVNKFLKKLNSKNLGFDFCNPHAFRHSFGTMHISQGTPLENIKTMLGHQKYDTTLIYSQIPTEILRGNINQVSTTKNSLLKRLLIKFGIIKINNKKISLSFCRDQFTIGRKEELTRLHHNIDKGINTLILGNIGIGKSHLIEQIDQEQKILKIDDLQGLKQTLGALLLFLYNGDKEHCKTLLYGNIPDDKVMVKINRLSVKNISQEICKIVEPKEYILSIDSLDSLTPKNIQFLEEIKDHFTIVACARSIKVDRSSFAWNYDRIDLKELPRKDAIHLIERLSYDLEVEDKSLFINHIFEQSNGNPRVIFEVIDRYRKEPVITNEVVRSIRHTGSLQEIDLTFVIFIGFGLMYLLRYMSREVDNDAFRFIGGVALVLTLLSRQLLSFTKKKYI